MWNWFCPSAEQQPNCRLCRFAALLSPSQVDLHRSAPGTAQTAVRQSKSTRNKTIKGDLVDLFAFAVHVYNTTKTIVSCLGNKIQDLRFRNVLPCKWGVSWGGQALVWQWKAAPVTLSSACAEGAGHTCFGSYDLEARGHMRPGHTVSLSIWHTDGVLGTEWQKSWLTSKHRTEQIQSFTSCF